MDGHFIADASRAAAGQLRMTILCMGAVVIPWRRSCRREPSLLIDPGEWGRFSCHVERSKAKPRHLPADVAHLSFAARSLGYARDDKRVAFGFRSK